MASLPKKSSFMTNLESLLKQAREVAGKRIPGPWYALPLPNTKRLYLSTKLEMTPNRPLTNDDTRFIVTAERLFDALIEVAEASAKVLHSIRLTDFYYGGSAESLEQALARLAEVKLP
jgi:hypothetical protein